MRRSSRGRPGPATGAGVGTLAGVAEPYAPHSFAAGYDRWEQGTAAQGIEYVTTRRIVEELGVAPCDVRMVRAHLLTAGPARSVPSLWRLFPGRAPGKG